MRTRSSRQGGQVTVLVLGLAVIVFAVAGLAVDGTRAFLYRRTLQNAADAAALAASGQLDTGAYYGTGGREVTLDPVAARREAFVWLTRRGLDARASVTTGDSMVAVTLRGELDTSFLSLVGIGQVPVAVLARARPVEGLP